MIGDGSLGYNIDLIADDPVLTASAPRTLTQDIAEVLNRHSAERGSDTPDFILAEMLCGVLEMFDAGIRARGLWYGHHCSIRDCDHGDGLAVGYGADPEVD